MTHDSSAITERSSKLDTTLAKTNYLVTSVHAAGCYGEGHEFENLIEYSRPVHTFTDAFSWKTEKSIPCTQK